MKGVRIGVTGARKADELATALQRRGAEPVLGPTLANVACRADAGLLAATDAVLDAEPTWVAASTGAGMRVWLDAADAHDRGGPLRALLAKRPCVARGPKAVGGLSYAGVIPEYVSVQETDADLAGWLRTRLSADDVLAVQLHGEGDDTAYRALQQLGATVLTVAPYRCERPADPGPAQRLVMAAADAQLDVVVATSRPAVRGLFAIAAELGAADRLREAFAAHVTAAAVGPVTASAFEEAGVTVSVMPARFRTADLVRALDSWHDRRWQVRTSQPVELVPDSQVARCGHHVVRLGDREFQILAALVRRPGIVCPPRLLAREAWGHAADDHVTTVKHQISRLRRKLAPTDARLTTVRGVGYRYDP